MKFLKLKDDVPFSKLKEYGFVAYSYRAYFNAKYMFTIETNTRRLYPTDDFSDPTIVYELTRDNLLELVEAEK